MGGSMCGDSLVLSIFAIINRVVLIAKIVVPIIIIALTTIDIIKDITGGEVKYKTTLDRVKFRIIAAVLIFFAPNLISLAFQIVDTDYSNNNLECLLHVTSRDVESALVAEVDEKISQIEFVIRTGGEFDKTKIDELYILANKVGDNTLKEFYLNKIENINTILENEIAEMEQARKESISKRFKEKEAMILAEAGLDVSLGPSKSGISLLAHNKPYTGAEIKYYSQSSSGPYGEINYSYGGRSYTYNASGCGCGYMSLSMIIDSLTGSSLTPLGIVNDFPPNKFAASSDEGKSYVNRCAINTGTLKDSSGKIKKDYGLEVETIYDLGVGNRSQLNSESTRQIYYKKIKDALKQGYSLIVLVPGHYTVFGAIDEDEYISFYDPSNSSNNGWFTIETIYNNHYNHSDNCIKGYSCGFIRVIAYKGKYPYSISSLAEYNRKKGIKPANTGDKPSALVQ